MRHLRLPLMILAASLAMPAAAGADTRIRGDGAQYVSAWGGALAWTERGPGATSRLVLHTGGRSLTVRRPASHGLVSPDVGPAPGGEPRAVFDACPAVRRCALYAVDTGSIEAVRVRGTRRRGSRPVAPSQWKGTYVYGRIRHTSPQTGRVRRGGLFVRRGKRERRLSSRVPQDTDLQGRRLAYSWWSRDVRTTEIRLGSVRSRRSCLVARSRGRWFVSSPVLDGGHLYWLRRDARTAGGRVYRVALPRTGCPTAAAERGATRLPEAAGGEEGGVDGLAVDAGTVYYSALGVWRADDPPPFPAG